MEKQRWSTQTAIIRVENWGLILASSTAPASQMQGREFNFWYQEKKSKTGNLNKQQ